MNPNDKKILSKSKLQEIVNQIDPRHTLDPEVEDILLEISDDFIESITGFGCALAKHRGSDTLEVKDLQLHLDRNWNIRIPGYASEIKPYKRANVTEAHKYRLGLVKRSRFQHQKQVEKQKKKEQQQEAAKNAQK